ncbi:hypothetical protein [Novosphingobium sp. M1R2S20]|uniref:Lipoprotein n=1 Tax=Novosphingobium rhizovicinum TaxID=3228928 RepID=A0ABV3RBM8_9SPHN
MKLLLVLAAPVALAGCATLPSPALIPQQQSDGLSRAEIGETVLVNGPRVTPLSVLEDSRCPMNARCVWAGRVRLKVRIDLGSGSQDRELTQGEPVQVADGTLELVEVQPDAPATNEAPLKPGDYRFGFRFMGGL